MELHRLHLRGLGALLHLRGPRLRRRATVAQGFRDRAGLAVLADAFPWVRQLPPWEQAVFVQEVRRTARYCLVSDNWEVLTRVMRQWQATAELYADPVPARRRRAARRY